MKIAKSASYALHALMYMVRHSTQLPVTAVTVAKAEGKAVRAGELPLAINKTLDAGMYTARLDLRDVGGQLIDRQTTEFRVIRGPF